MSIQPLSNGLFSVVTTDGCTAKCAHCLMCCKPGKKTKLTFEQIQRSIDQVKKNYSLSMVVFTGGEPTLLGEDLFRAIRYCTMNMLHTRLVTNAHWATSPERARKYIKKFRDVGLEEINYSVDDYHAPYVPLEKVKMAWQASKNVGFTSVLLANSRGIKDIIVPAYIQKFFGEKIPVSKAITDTSNIVNIPKAADGTQYMIYENSLQKSGRAAEELNSSKFKPVKDQGMLMSPCTWAGSEPVLSPGGHIWACCGIPCENNQVLDLGDTAKEPIKKILERASNDVLLNAIYYLGPLYLCQFVEAHSSIKFSKNFCGVCEICSALTENKEAIKVIRSNFAKLVPQIFDAEEREKATTFDSVSRKSSTRIKS